MKKTVVLLLSLLLISCSKPKDIIENTLEYEPYKNINGKITEINNEILTIYTDDNNSLTFNIKDLEIDEYFINDYISIIYSGIIDENTDNIKINSIILQQREIKEPELLELTGKVVKGTTYNKIIITDGNQTLTLLNETVEIMFEGDLVAGMNIKITYLTEKIEEYDGILQSLEILDS